MKYTYHTDGSKPPLDGTIFVFGSNLAGAHGAGAAKEAFLTYGAVYGKGFGEHGSSWAIPTKDEKIRTISIREIKQFVQEFVAEASSSDKSYFITRIGCGLAGYKDQDIAPLFQGAPTNCNFPEEWKMYLE